MAKFEKVVKCEISMVYPLMILMKNLCEYWLFQKIINFKDILMNFGYVGGHTLTFNPEKDSSRGLLVFGTGEVNGTLPIWAHNSGTKLGTKMIFTKYERGDLGLSNEVWWAHIGLLLTELRKTEDILGHPKTLLS